MTQYPICLIGIFFATVLFLCGSPASGQELSRSDLLSMYESPPTVAHLHCPGSMSSTACRELTSEVLFSNETSELKPTHIASSMSDLALQVELRNCSEVSSPFAVTDKMYGTDPIQPRGPFKLFKLSFDDGEEVSPGRVLVIAKGYQRNGADRDLGWSSYYIISPEDPCTPKAVELIQGDEDLRLVETLIQHKDEIYLLTLLQQEQQGQFYSGRVTRLGPDGAEDLIGVAIKF
jgi:hypothetical protein